MFQENWIKLSFIKLLDMAYYNQGRNFKGKPREREETARSSCICTVKRRVAIDNNICSFLGCQQPTTGIKQFTSVVYYPRKVSPIALISMKAISTYNANAFARVRNEFVDPIGTESNSIKGVGEISWDFLSNFKQRLSEYANNFFYSYK